MAKLILADEISPDTCRFWDLTTKESMDKDRFRKDLGKIEEAYREVLKRVVRMRGWWGPPLFARATRGRGRPSLGQGRVWRVQGGWVVEKVAQSRTTPPSPQGGFPIL